MFSFCQFYDRHLVYQRVYATGRLMWWDSKLWLCDQRDGQVFMTLDCNIPTARGFQVVTDESRKSPKM